MFVHRCNSPANLQLFIFKSDAPKHALNIHKMCHQKNTPHKILNKGANEHIFG